LKIGILTFPNSISYGATLQMYALYRSVEKLGYDTEIINYFNAYMKAENHVGDSVHSFSKMAKKFAKKLMHYKLYSNFKRFESCSFNMFPKRAFSDKKILNEVGKRYDAVICGSDQVWNPEITDGDLSYFLDFCCDKTKRISYAPSFGVDTLSEQFGIRVGKELEQFDSISVREQEGAEIVKCFSNRSAEIVSDPTFLLDRSDWESIEKEYDSTKKEYILYYAVHQSDELFKKAKSFSKRTGIKLVVVGGNRIKNLKNNDPLLEYAIDISPQEWLYLIHHAKYVITNSFHGTAFSLIYQKDFFVGYVKNTNSRLSQIIRTTVMESRILGCGDEIIAKKADFTFAESAINQLRESSYRFLKNALE